MYKSKYKHDFMCNKKLNRVLLGGLIFLLAGYTNSFSQLAQTEKFSSGSQITSPTDTHCITVAGDLNGDYRVNLTDVSLYASCISPGGCALLPPFCRYEINGDGLILSVADLVRLLKYVLEGGLPPVKSEVCCLSPYFPPRKTPGAKPIK